LGFLTTSKLSTLASTINLIQFPFHEDKLIQPNIL
jgi:hypothetical protein